MNNSHRYRGVGRGEVEVLGGGVMFCYDTVLCSIMIRASARPAFMRKASAGSPLRGDRPAGSVCRAPDLT